MDTEAIKTIITGTVPEATFDETGEWLTATIPAMEWKKLASQLRYPASCHFDFLFCITCIDWKTHLAMVYHLTSTTFRHNLVIKCNLDRSNPEIETVCNIWRTAEFHEREQYELFGVKFLNHPDLRRLILTDDFEGWPLRKDFEDPVNMIKL
ncbi:MAG: NADH-quinone oxidoreductase subunit C [Bacteroidota bacterium]